MPPSQNMSHFRPQHNCQTCFRTRRYYIAKKRNSQQDCVIRRSFYSKSLTVKTTTRWEVRGIICAKIGSEFLFFFNVRRYRVALRSRHDISRGRQRVLSQTMMLSSVRDRAGNPELNRAKCYLSSYQGLLHFVPRSIDVRWTPSKKRFHKGEKSVNRHFF